MTFLVCAASDISEWRLQGHPDVALLPRQAKNQCLGARPINQRALLLLDRQLTFLRLVDGQRGKGLQIGRVVSLDR